MATIYTDIALTVKQIREALDNLAKYRAEPKHYDKLGFSFNRDSRCCGIKIKLSLDTWVGVYGDSSSGPILSLSKPEVFTTAFVAVLNEHIEQLLLNTAAKLEASCGDALKAHIAELEAQLTGVGWGVEDFEALWAAYGVADPETAFALANCERKSED